MELLASIGVLCLAGLALVAVCKLLSWFDTNSELRYQLSQKDDVIFSLNLIKGSLQDRIDGLRKGDISVEDL